MKNLFIIIQARMTSTRLPKKVMLELCGKTVLEIMIDRLGDFRENIIIATTNDGSEKPIVDLCRKLNIRYYRGDTSDVLSRYYESAIEFGAKENDTIVRLTSDCPFIDKEILKEMIKKFEDNSYDYLSNCENRTFPRGLDIQIVNFKSLQKAYLKAENLSDREHVLRFIHTTDRDNFKIGEFKDRENNSKYRLTLDEPLDYEAIKELYSRFDNKIDFSYRELIKLLKDNEYIFEINREVQQKKI